MLFTVRILCYSGRHMEETLRLATWNIHGALSDPDRVEAVLEELSRENADIITLPDAWHEDSDLSEPTERKLLLTAGDFRRRGFTALKATFRENRPDDNFARYGFMTLINNTVSPTYETIQLGTRPAHHLRLDLGSSAISIVSLYLNDQTEMNRMVQTQELLTHLSTYESDAVALVGDFNAMHSSAPIARLLGVRPTRGILQKLPLMNGALPRLTQMADGIVMRTLEANRFIDADPTQHPTMPSRMPLFQLDHIMYRESEDIAVSATLPTHDGSPDLSDHLRLTSTLTLTKK